MRGAKSLLLIALLRLAMAAAGRLRLGQGSSPDLDFPYSFEQIYSFLNKVRPRHQAGNDLNYVVPGLVPGSDFSFFEACSHSNQRKIPVALEKPGSDRFYPTDRYKILENYSLMNRPV